MMIQLLLLLLLLAVLILVHDDDDVADAVDNVSDRADNADTDDKVGSFVSTSPNILPGEDSSFHGRLFRPKSFYEFGNNLCK